MCGWAPFLAKAQRGVLSCFLEKVPQLLLIICWYKWLLNSLGQTECRPSNCWLFWTSDLYRGKKYEKSWTTDLPDEQKSSLSQRHCCFISLFQCFLFVRCYSSHSRETGMRDRKQRFSPWPFSPIPFPLLSSNRLVTKTKPKPKTGIRIAVFAIHWATNHSSFFPLNNSSDAMTHYTQSHMN